MAALLPIEHLDHLAAALAAGRWPDPAAVEIFVEVWRRHRRGHMSFDDAVGRSGAVALRLRNEQLLAAAALLDDGKKGYWELAGDLASACNRFEADVFPRIRRGGSPKSPLNAILWRARQAAGRALPCSRRQLFRLLTNSGGECQ
jgi:hypothetical protein